MSWLQAGILQILVLFSSAELNDLRQQVPVKFLPSKERRSEKSANVFRDGRLQHKVQSPEHNPDDVGVTTKAPPTGEDLSAEGVSKDGEDTLDKGVTTKAPPTGEDLSAEGVSKDGEDTLDKGVTTKVPPTGEDLSAEGVSKDGGDTLDKGVTTKAPPKGQDLSAEGVSKDGEDLIHKMLEDESRGGDEPEVVKTPEIEEEEKKKKEEEAEKDDLTVAAEKLFDKPAEKMKEAAAHGEVTSQGHGEEASGHGEEASGHGEGDSEGHGEVAAEGHGPHKSGGDGHGHDAHGAEYFVHEDGHFLTGGHRQHGPTDLDKKVRILLLITPVLVLASWAYYFLITDIEIEGGVQTGMTTKLAGNQPGFRHRLGKVMEHPLINATVLLLILVDLCCAVVHDLLDQTDILNPKYHIMGEALIKDLHAISIYILCGFIVEQMLHILCFGKAYFYHFWYVMDLVTAYMSLVGETVLHNSFGDMIQFLVLMRLWKVITIVFDIFLANEETHHMHEKISKQKLKIQARRRKSLLNAT